MCRLLLSAVLKNTVFVLMRQKAALSMLCMAYTTSSQYSVMPCLMISARTSFFSSFCSLAVSCKNSPMSNPFPVIISASSYCTLLGLSRCVNRYG